MISPWGWFNLTCPVNLVHSLVQAHFHFVEVRSIQLPGRQFSKHPKIKAQAPEVWYKRSHCEGVRVQRLLNHVAIVQEPILSLHQVLLHAGTHINWFSNGADKPGHGDVQLAQPLILPEHHHQPWVEVDDQLVRLLAHLQDRLSQHFLNPADLWVFLLPLHLQLKLHQVRSQLDDEG